MSSLFGLLGVARDGMLAQTAGLDVTGNNISNVNTPGYTKENALFETAPGVMGVRFTGIARSYDRFAQAQVTSESGNQGAADARSSALDDLQGVVAPGSGQTIGDKLDAFYASMTALSQNPSDSSTRASVLSSANDLATSFSTAANGIAQQKGDLLASAQSTASEINDRLKQIATLNDQIASAQGSGSDTSSLKDSRDQLVSEVGQRINVQSVEDASGRVTLLSSGASLVDGSTANALEVGVDTNGAMQIQVDKSGGAKVDISSKVTGGKLGGLKEARDTDLTAAASSIDQLAYDVSTSVNAVHSTGVGLDGVGNRNLFTQPTQVKGAAQAMTIDPSVGNDPSKLAASSTASGLPAGNDVALKLSQLSSQALGSGGTPDQAFASIAADVGTRKQNADSELALRTDTLAQATTRQQSASGVSVDEEMIDLTKYQNAFNANMKVLTTVSDLLDQLVKSI